MTKDGSIYGDATPLRGFVGPGGTEPSVEQHRTKYFLRLYSVDLGA